MLDDNQAPPVVLIITGAPATGKTTLAHYLAGRLRLPLISKDTIKEGLGDVLGCDDISQSQRLGRASMLILYRMLETLLAAHQPCIIESFFHLEHSTRDLLALRQRRPFLPLQIRCSCEASLQQQRWLQRIQSGERHPVHIDDRRDVPTSLQRLVDFLPIGGERLDVDTTIADETHYDALARTLQERLRRLR